MQRLYPFGMLHKNSRLYFGLGLCGWLVLTAGLSKADAILDFGAVAPGSGSISYAGGSNPLIGTGIKIADVVGIDTPMRNGTSLACLQCLLNFTTGTLVTHTATFWEFAPGGSIMIQGGVDADGNHNLDAGEPNGVLMSGSFSVDSFVYLGPSGFRVVAGGFTDQPSGALASLYGLTISQSPYSGALNLQFRDNHRYTELGLIRSSTILSGDVSDTAPTPEPASMSLLGGGLFAVGVLGRNRLKAIAVQRQSTNRRSS